MDYLYHELSHVFFFEVGFKAFDNFIGWVLIKPIVDCKNGVVCVMMLAFGLELVAQIRTIALLIVLQEDYDFASY